MPELPVSRYALGMKVDATSYSDAITRIMAWAKAGESRSVCAATVHMVMEAFDNSGYQHVVNEADLVTPDGVPLVWTLQFLGVRNATRVYGPDLMSAVLTAAEAAGVPVGLYGSGLAVMHGLTQKLRSRFPTLNIAYAFAPPFRSLSGQEEQKVIEDIRSSGIRILFVGLGCPKQELWMARHRHRIPAVMLGVGAAFDFLAGSKPQAPGWMQCAGLEWLFRLATEPRRLFWRYVKHNPRFLFFIARQIMFDSSRGRA